MRCYSFNLGLVSGKMTKCTMNAFSRLLKMENIHFMYMDTKIYDHSDEKWGSETKDLGFHVFMSRQSRSRPFHKLRCILCMFNSSTTYFMKIV